MEGFRAAGTAAVKEAAKAEHWRRKAVEQLLFKMTGTVLAQGWRSVVLAAC